MEERWWMLRNAGQWPDVIHPRRISMDKKDEKLGQRNR
jgi:hypothetical protein